MNKTCTKDNKLWLDPFIADVRFMAMNEAVQVLDEQMGANTPVSWAWEPHWVQCGGYRCLGILDKNGKWKSFATGEELNDVTKVYPD